MDTIYEKVIAAIRIAAREPHGDFPPKTQLRAIVEDSIDLVGLIFEIEEAFGFDIPVDALEDLGTIADLVEKLRQLELVAGQKQETQ